HLEPMLSDVAITLDDLLPVQRQAVTHRAGPLLVVGAAGTGKTSVIEARYQWLVAVQGVAPERIALVTPARARADLLQARLELTLAGGYDELFVLTPVALAVVLLDGARAGFEAGESLLEPGDRLAMLLERIDELSLERHDFGGSANALLGGLIRRIDRLKGHLIGAEEFAAWACALADDPSRAALECEFAEVYRTHERMLAEAGARD